MLYVQARHAVLEDSDVLFLTGVDKGLDITSNPFMPNSSCNCRNIVAIIIISISIFCFAVISLFCIAIISLFCFTVISIFCFVTLQSKGTIHGHG